MSHSKKEYGFIHQFLNESVEDSRSLKANYFPQVDEPCIFHLPLIPSFTVTKLQISGEWCRWLRDYHGRKTGKHLSWYDISEISFKVYWDVVSTIEQKQRFWEVPPQIKTQSQLISQAWVMYMCIEENMSPKEALTLGYSLLDLKNKRWGCHET